MGLAGKIMIKDTSVVVSVICHWAYVMVGNPNNSTGAFSMSSEVFIDVEASAAETGTNYVGETMWSVERVCLCAVATINAGMSYTGSSGLCEGTVCVKGETVVLSVNLFILIAVFVFVSATRVDNDHILPTVEMPVKFVGAFAASAGVGEGLVASVLNAMSDDEVYLSPDALVMCLSGVAVVGREPYESSLSIGV